jgi:hypothetical protein
MKKKPGRQDPKTALPKIKPKTKAMLELMANNPTINQTNAYMQTHQTTNYQSAAASASALLKTPNVIIYREKQVQMAIKNIVAIASDIDVKAETRLKANQDILDRTVGKAIQKTEVKQENINLNIEASQELADNFAEYLKSKLTP